MNHLWSAYIAVKLYISSTTGIENCYIRMKEYTWCSANWVYIRMDIIIKAQALVYNVPFWSLNFSILAVAILFLLEPTRGHIWTRGIHEHLVFLLVSLIRLVFCTVELIFAVKLSVFNIRLKGGWLIFGVGFKWLFEELQFISLVDCCLVVPVMWIHFYL